MPFHTLRFGIFVLLLWPLFLAAPHNVRWALLLGASLLFFAALGIPALLGALAGVIAISYVGGLVLERQADTLARRVVLWSGIVANVLILAGFKYLPFGALTGSDAGGGTLLATVGISYFTFQGISYLVDVYIGSVKAEAHLGYLALYMSFFPKLLQGPIERAGELLPQLRQRFVIDEAAFRAGALLFLWGLFKKTVVADRAAPLVEAVYDSAGAYTGIPVALATYLYAVQIYCDFSGYTDMALGIGRLFGIKLTQNFANPYLSRSIAEFWRRWHISFSRWILDYLFKPLQFTLRDWGTHGSAVALIVTFFISGLWHGAGWTYVVWGLMHGVYMAVAIYTRSFRRTAHKWFFGGRPMLGAAWQVFATLHLVLLSWVVFRAGTVADAVQLLSSVGPGTDGVLSLLFSNGIYSFAILTLASAAVAWVDVLKGPRIACLLQSPPWLRWAGYYALTAAVLVLGVEGRGTFIYFQF